MKTCRHACLSFSRSYGSEKGHPSRLNGTSSTQRNNRSIRLLLFILPFLLVGCGRNCVDHDSIIFVPTGSSYEMLLDTLSSEGHLTTIGTFDRLARLKKLDRNVKPGRYRLKKGMSCGEVVTMLRGGMQAPLNLRINNIRTIDQLAGRLASQIEADSSTLYRWLASDSVAQNYGFTAESFIAMFIPNTYQVYWTISPEALLKRMKREYDRFWTRERENCLSRTGLSKIEVSILASIVSQETEKADEMPVIAGVYINRLRRNMLLQADPTVKFAVGDFTLRRILKKHLRIDSPYNTYLYPGLPPGPICMPAIAAIDAVLNYQEHDWLYFCAKGDFSGYHNFARTLTEHNRNARAYARSLNKAGIR